MSPQGMDGKREEGRKVNMEVTDPPSSSSPAIVEMTTGASVLASSQVDMGMPVLCWKVHLALG